MALNWIEGVLNNSRHTGTDLLLMLLMAEAADRDTGSCYPGRKTLARLMRCSERTVQRTIQTLVDSGEVAVKVQGSHYGTNLYTLSRSLLGGDVSDSPYAQSTTGGDNSDSLGGDKNVSGGETKMSPKPSVEPSVKKERDKSLLLSEFQNWYEQYPRKEKRLDAEKAWLKLTDDDRTAAAEALPAFLPYYEHKRLIGEPHFIPLPTTWLNGKRWLDDPPMIERPKAQPSKNGKLAGSALFEAMEAHRIGKEIA